MIKEVPIPIDHDTTMKFADECFSFDLGFRNNNLSISNFYSTNRQDIVIGMEKSGMFSSKATASVRNTNPCIVTTGMTTYSIEIKQPWYTKWWITGPIGFATGYLTSKVGGL